MIQPYYDSVEKNVEINVFVKTLLDRIVIASSVKKKKKIVIVSALSG